MPDSFGIAAAQAARYAYERYVYTTGPLSLGTAAYTIFSAQNWNRPTGPTWRAELVGIAASRDSRVQMTATADPANQMNQLYEGATTALPANLAMQEAFLTGIQQLMLQLHMTTGTVSNFHVNYAVAMRRLSAADKILAHHAGLQGYTLTPDEELALKHLDLAREVNGRLVVDRTGLEQLKALVNKGTSPVGPARMLSGIYENRMLQGSVDLYEITVDTTEHVFAYYRSEFDPSRPTRGRFLVLRELAIPATSPPNIWLRVDRDGQQALLDLRGSGFQQPDGSFDLWIPAIDHISLRVVLASGSPVTVPIRVRVLALDMSEVLAVQFGLVSSPEMLENPATFWKAIAGLV